MHHRSESLIVAISSKPRAVGTEKIIRQTRACMARDLHSFVYFMESARSTLRWTADEIGAAAGRRGPQKILNFFLGSGFEIR